MAADPIDFWFTMGSTYTYLSVMRLGELEPRTFARYLHVWCEADESDSTLTKRFAGIWLAALSTNLRGGRRLDCAQFSGGILLQSIELKVFVAYSSPLIHQMRNLFPKRIERFH